jgi:hypothetical protein
LFGVASGTSSLERARRRPSSGTRACEDEKEEGARFTCQRHGGIVTKDSLIFFRIVGSPVQFGQRGRARARARLPDHGPDWVRLSQVLFILFFFSFSARLGNL